MAALWVGEGRRAKQKPERVPWVRGPQRWPKMAAAAASQPLPSRALGSQQDHSSPKISLCGPHTHAQRMKPSPPNQYATTKPWTSCANKGEFISCFIYKCQKLKEIQMPFNRWMSKEIVANGCSDNGLVLDNKNEGTIAAHSIRDKSQLCWVKKSRQKKSAYCTVPFL